jgi:hypothetical protein
MGGVWFLTYYTNFKWKLTYWELVGSGSEDDLSIGTKKKNRFKPKKGGTSWVALFPIFKNKEVEPWPEKFRYHNQNIYGMKLGEQYIPCSLNIDQRENKELIANLDPVPNSIREWSSLEDERIEKEFQKQDMWTQNKMLIFTFGVVIACLVALIVTVWLVSKMLQGNVAGPLNSLADRLGSMGQLN